MASADQTQAQLAKATFVKFIDHLYKISDPKASFLYGDMAFPQTARTLRVLQHLLNYLFYYNSLKEEVKERVQPLFDTYSKQKKENSKLSQELEKLKLQNDHVSIGFITVKSLLKALFVISL